MRLALPAWYKSWLDAALAVNAVPIFFVIGCQKSGTTWLQKLLDAHPNVRCGGEGHLFDHLLSKIDGAVRAYNESQANKGTDGHPQLDQTASGVLGKMAADRVLVEYLQSSPDATAVRTLGDKTPENAVAIHLAEQFYARPKYIHIIRDGRDCAVSGWAHLKRRGQDRRFGGFAEYAAYMAEHHWKRYIMTARSQAAGFPDRYLEVRYEALHADPKGEAVRLFEFLSVATDPAVIHACVEAASFDTLSGGRPAGEEDPSSHFRKGIVGDWREHFDSEALERFESIAGDLLAELGYKASEALTRA